jgi:hypothetical protein
MRRQLSFSKKYNKKSMTPDRFTFLPMLNACASLQALEEGRHIHEQIIQSVCKGDIFVGCSLVDMYAKCGSMEDAQSMSTRCHLEMWSLEPQ